jgi:hypothetical protein
MLSREAPRQLEWLMLRYKSMMRLGGIMRHAPGFD